jgi:hypothetical protein
MANSNAKRSGTRPIDRKTPAPVAGVAPAAKYAPVSLSNEGQKTEQRAYEIYMKRVSADAPGDEVADWLQAEAELRSEEE